MRIRPLTEADAPAAAALLNEIADHDGGGHVSAEELLLWLGRPGEFVVLEEDGAIRAYADLVAHAEGSDLTWLDPRLLPEDRDSPRADALLAWAEERTPGLRLLASVAAAAGYEPVLERRGYRRIRASYDMEIELGDTDPPVVPAGIEIRTVRDGEARSVFEAMDEGFRDHWGHEPDTFEHWSGHALGPDFDPALWFLADADGEIAGGSLCRVRTLGGEQVGWVGQLAVRRPWRRRGLGRALLLHSFRVFRERGLARAGLGVDAENPTGAVRLYERAGMRVASRRDTWELDRA